MHTPPTNQRPAGWLARLRDLHRKRYSDSQIAEALNQEFLEEGCQHFLDRHEVRRWRLKLGLPACKRKKVLEAGSLPEYHAEARRKEAARAGFGHLLDGAGTAEKPGGDLSLREIKILRVLCDSAEKPLTRREVAEVLRVPRSKQRRFGNCHTDAFARLLARHCIVRAGVRSRAGRSGRPEVLYAPAPGIGFRPRTQRPTRIEQEERRYLRGLQFVPLLSRGQLREEESDTDQTDDADDRAAATDPADAGE